MKIFRCFILLLIFTITVPVYAQEGSQEYTPKQEEDIQGTLFDYINNMNELDVLKLDQ